MCQHWLHFECLSVSLSIYIHKFNWMKLFSNSEDASRTVTCSQYLSEGWGTGRCTGTQWAAVDASACRNGHLCSLTLPKPSIWLLSVIILLADLKSRRNNIKLSVLIILGNMNDILLFHSNRCASVNIMGRHTSGERKCLNWVSLCIKVKFPTKLIVALERLFLVCR